MSFVQADGGKPFHGISPDIHDASMNGPRRIYAATMKDVWSIYEGLIKQVRRCMRPCERSEVTCGMNQEVLNNSSYRHYLRGTQIASLRSQ